MSATQTDSATQTESATESESATETDSATDTDTATTEPDTETGGEVCDEGVQGGLVGIDLGELPTESVNGSEVLGHRAIVECTVDALGKQLVLRCIGSDEAEHVVSIELGNAPTIAVGAAVTLRYMTWTQLYESCAIGKAPDPIWFSVRDADDALVLGGLRAGAFQPYPGLNDDGALDDMFAPFELERTEHCAITGSSGSCEERPIAVQVSTPDDAGGLLTVGQDLQVGGVSFTLGFGLEVVLDPELECCIEGDVAAMEMSMVGAPG